MSDDNKPVTPTRPRAVNLGNRRPPPAVPGYAPGGPAAPNPGGVAPAPGGGAPVNGTPGPAAAPNPGPGGTAPPLGNPLPTAPGMGAIPGGAAPVVAPPVVAAPVVAPLVMAAPGAGWNARPTPGATPRAPGALGSRQAAAPVAPAPGAPGNAVPVNPAPANVGPANPAPVNVGPVRPAVLGAAIPLRDLDGGKKKAPLAQNQRRWTVNAMAAFGLQPTMAQGRVLGSVIATAARVDEAAFDPAAATGAAALRVAAGGGASKQVTQFIDELGKVEALPPPRTAAALKKLREAIGAAKRTKPTDAAVVAALARAEEQMAVYDLREEVLGFGAPPWSDDKAARATSAKVKIDLLSLAGTGAAFEPLGAEVKGANQAYWINRQGGTGQDKSFICKPMVNTVVVNGYPPGGDVVREALAGRAAGVISKLLDQDLHMPETQMIQLPSTFLTGAVLPPGESVTCSVQEFRPSGGAVGERSRSSLGAIPADECQAMAVFDMLTMNTDRHAGNLIMDGNSLVPIDHGCTFMDPGLDDGMGLQRAQGAFGSGYNALLGLPGTHAPMPAGLVSKLRELDPAKLRKTLQGGSDKLRGDTAKLGVAGANNVPGADAVAARKDNLVSDDALAMTERSAAFLKLAAGVPGLSMAAAQVAFGVNIRALAIVPMKEFAAMANPILQAALRDQPVTQLACLMSPVDKAAVTEAVRGVGWLLAQENPPGGIQADPALMVKIAAYGVAPTGVAPAPAAAGAPTPAALKAMYDHFPGLDKNPFLFGSTVSDADKATRLQTQFNAWTALLPNLHLEAELDTFGARLSGKLPIHLYESICNLLRIKAAIAAGDAQAGSAVASVTQGIRPVRVAGINKLVALAVGPLGGQWGADLAAAQVAGNPDAALAALSDRLFDAARANLSREAGEIGAAHRVLDGNAGGAAPDVAAAAKLARDTALGAIKAAIGSGKLEAADQLVGAVAGYVRPNWA